MSSNYVILTIVIFGVFVLLAYQMGYVHGSRYGFLEGLKKWNDSNLEQIPESGEKKTHPMGMWREVRLEEEEKESRPY